MKLATILMAFGLIFGVLAEPVPKKSFGKRGLQDFLTVISSINDQVLVVQGLFKSYTGGDATDLINASHGLVDTINTGTQTVNAQSPLSETDALGLVQPILDLTDDVNATVDVAINKETLMADNGYHQDVLDNLIAQKTASENLADAITAKVPASMQDLAAELAANIAAAIQRGIDAYET